MEKTKEKSKSMKVNKKVVKAADDLMKELLGKLDVDASVTIEPGSYTNADGGKEEFVDISIDGEDIGVLIGYMGRNLRSLQKIVTLLLNRRLGVKTEELTYVRVVMDVLGYRDKRQETLKRMADQVHSEVIASGEPADLPPMTSFERRVIHSHLGEYGDVSTESFGEGDGRFVRVSPSGSDNKDDDQVEDA